MKEGYAEISRGRGGCIDAGAMVLTLGIFGVETIEYFPKIAPKYIPYFAVDSPYATEYGPFNHYEFKVVPHFWGLAKTAHAPEPQPGTHE